VWRKVKLPRRVTPLDGTWSFNIPATLLGVTPWTCPGRLIYVFNIPTTLQLL
jgi:hypothetical protein